MLAHIRVICKPVQGDGRSWKANRGEQMCVGSGGAEHAVLHLLYARFWHKVLYDVGVVTTKEPFQRLVSQGMILGEVCPHDPLTPCLSHFYLHCCTATNQTAPPGTWESFLAPLAKSNLVCEPQACSFNPVAGRWQIFPKATSSVHGIITMVVALQQSQTQRCPSMLLNGRLCPAGGVHSVQG